MADADVIAEEYVLKHWDSEQGAQPFKLLASLPKPHAQGGDQAKDNANSKGKKNAFIVKKKNQRKNPVIQLISVLSSTGNQKHPKL